MNKRHRDATDVDAVAASPPTSKKPRLDGRVLIFLDLEDRKVFGDISEKKWMLVDVLLDDANDGVSLRFDDIEFPIYRGSVVVAISEREDPAEYKRMRDVFTVDLKQTLGDIYFRFS